VLTQSPPFNRKVAVTSFLQSSFSGVGRSRQSADSSCSVQVELVSGRHGFEMANEDEVLASSSKPGGGDFPPWHETYLIEFRVQRARGFLLRFLAFPFQNDFLE